jgi:hypothetical protein
MKTIPLTALLLALITSPALGKGLTAKQANIMALGRLAGTFEVLKGRGDTRSRDVLLSAAEHPEGMGSSIEQTNDNPARYKLSWTDKKTGQTYTYLLSHADFAIFAAAYENYVCGKEGLPHDPQVCKRGNVRR